MQHLQRLTKATTTGLIDTLKLNGDSLPATTAEDGSTEALAFLLGLLTVEEHGGAAAGGGGGGDGAGGAPGGTSSNPFALLAEEHE